ncbi:MAG TPA: hypothetical protein K8V16_03515 [Rubneribacter badeniensis]|uniref:Lipoprotein n=1 Tax=Rubneribacter badeniensis TaxID=2070688 RepID=A0A9D3ACU8_9ACTN|nr:hypothetical protein [Rubneribacter badeniensis]
MGGKTIGAWLGAALCLAALSGCAGPASLKGTTWYYSTGSEVKSIQFSGEERGVTSEGLSFSYEADGDVVTIDSGLGGSVLTRSERNGVEILEGNGYVFYQDQAIPQSEIDAARQEKERAVAAEAEKRAAELREELEGTWRWANENGYYDYTDARTVTFNADGTWESSMVEHDVERSGNWDVEVTERTAEGSGVWKVVYSGEKTTFDRMAFDLNISKADGSEFSQEEKGDFASGYPSEFFIKNGEIAALSRYERQ